MEDEGVSLSCHRYYTQHIRHITVQRLVAVRAEVRTSYVDRIFSVDVDDVGWEDGLCGGG